MADTNNEPSSRIDHRLDVLLDAIAETNANVNQLVTLVNQLVTLMDRHLRFDHGYGDEDQ